MTLSWQTGHLLRDEAKTIIEKKLKMSKGKDSRSKKLQFEKRREP